MISAGANSHFKETISVIIPSSDTTKLAKEPFKANQAC